MDVQIGPGTEVTEDRNALRTEVTAVPKFPRTEVTGDRLIIEPLCIRLSECNEYFLAR